MNQVTRLSVVLVLNLAMIAGLVFTGLYSHSLGVLAAGGDYVADSVVIGLGLLAVRLSRHSSGYPYSTTTVALINALLLLGVTGFVVVEAIHRLVSHVPEIKALPVIVVSAVAGVVMIVGALILGGDDDKEDLHIRSVMLDTVADAASATAVVATGSIILATRRFYWLDSAAALVIGVVIGCQAIKLIRDVITTMRQSQPGRGEETG